MKPGSSITSFTSKKGNAVIFRYPRKEDLSDMLQFINDLIEEDTFILMSGSKLTRKDEEKFLSETLVAIAKGEKIQIVAEVNGTFAGNCELRRGIRRKNHVGNIGIALGKNFRDEGIGKKLLSELIVRGKAMGLRLLTITCMENNDSALHLYEKLGFRRAGIIPGALEYKGKDVGEIMLYLPLIKKRESKNGSGG